MRTREEILAYARKHQKEYRKKHMEHHKEYMRKYLNEYHKRPEQHDRYLMRQHAYRTLKDNKIVCSKCGCVEILELHHKRYTKNPDDVEILCRPCHKRFHNNLTS